MSNRLSLPPRSNSKRSIAGAHQLYFHSCRRLFEFTRSRIKGLMKLDYPKCKQKYRHRIVSRYYRHFSGAEPLKLSCEGSKTSPQDKTILWSYFLARKGKNSRAHDSRAPNPSGTRVPAVKRKNPVGFSCILKIPPGFPRRGTA